MGYPPGTRPKIRINWDSFVGQGIAASWKGPFTDCVINGYTRWMNLAGVNVRPVFWGYTTSTTPTAGELLVFMSPWHGGGANRIASTLGSNNAHYIEYHRRSGVNGTVWNFVPWNAMPGEIDMQGVFIHELGHALGLGHSNFPVDAMFGSYNYHSTRYGPWERDVAALKALAPDHQQNRLRQLRSTDGGSSWSAVGNELTAHSHWHTRTNQSPGACAIRASGLYTVGWTHSNRIPTWIRTDGDKLLSRIWWYYGGQRSPHGFAFASDDQGTMLFARVDNDENGTLRVSRSVDTALTWSSVGKPNGGRSCGTPGVAWTKNNGVSTWIMVWPYFSRSDHAATGLVHVSTSTDDGATWTPPVVLNNFIKALSGASVAASDDNDIVVAIAYANHTSAAAFNRIVTFEAEVIGSQVQVTSQFFTNESTRIQPAVTFDHAHQRFVLAWRGQNGATTLATMTMAPGSGAWTGKSDLLGFSSHVAPALASSREYGESVMWYAHE